MKLATLIQMIQRQRSQYPATKAPNTQQNNVTFLNLIQN
jgi:hypothetical protein